MASPRSFVALRCLAYTALMLRRVVRWTVAGAALALALHVYMLSGHGHHQAAGPLTPLGSASHLVHSAMHDDSGMGAELEGGMVTGDMLATCLAVVGTLVLGSLAGRRTRPAFPPPVEAIAPGSRRHRDPPRARSPVELCVSRR